MHQSWSTHRCIVIYTAVHHALWHLIVKQFRNHPKSDFRTMISSKMRWFLLNISEFSEIMLGALKTTMYNNFVFSKQCCQLFILILGKFLGILGKKCECWEDIGKLSFGSESQRKSQNTWKLIGMLFVFYSALYRLYHICIKRKRYRCTITQKILRVFFF